MKPPHYLLTNSVTPIYRMGSTEGWPRGYCIYRIPCDELGIQAVYRVYRLYSTDCTYTEGMQRVLLYRGYTEGIQGIPVGIQQFIGIRKWMAWGKQGIDLQVYRHPSGVAVLLSSKSAWKTVFQVVFLLKFTGKITYC